VGLGSEPDPKDSGVFVWVVVEVGHCFRSGPPTFIVKFPGFIVALANSTNHVSGSGSRPRELNCSTQDLGDNTLPTKLRLKPNGEEVVASEQIQQITLRVLCCNARIMLNSVSADVLISEHDPKPINLRVRPHRVPIRENFVGRINVRPHHFMRQLPFCCWV